MPATTPTLSNFPASTLISNVLKRLDELDVQNPVHWSRAEVLGHLNDAVAEYQLVTWELQHTEAVGVSTSSNMYSVPTSFVAPLAVRHGDGGNSLRKVTVEHMDRDCQWESPDDARLHAREWAPMGFDRFIIHPRPLAAGQLFVDGIDIHTPLADSATSYLPVRQEYVPVIEDWVVNRSALKEGGQLLYRYAQHYFDFLTLANRIKGIDVTKLRPKLPSGVMDNAGLREGAESLEANG